jgi:hypothetical protein
VYRQIQRYTEKATKSKIGATRVKKPFVTASNYSSSVVVSLAKQNSQPQSLPLGWCPLAKGTAVKNVLVKKKGKEMASYLYR